MEEGGGRSLFSREVWRLLEVELCLSRFEGKVEWQPLREAEEREGRVALEESARRI